MVTRALRIRRPFEFTRVRRQGRSWSNRLVVVAMLPNGRAHNRYGFAVGRRVGNAVARNRVKRWLREAVRHLHPCLRSGYDLVFIARGTLANPDVTYQEVYDAVLDLTRRAKLQSQSESEPGARPSTSTQDRAS